MGVRPSFQRNSGGLPRCMRGRVFFLSSGGLPHPASPDILNALNLPLTLMDDLNLLNLAFRFFR